MTSQTLIVPGDYNTTIAFCVEQFKSTALAAIKRNGNFYVALSGGETPRAIFQKLAQEKNFPWQNIHLFWSDERCVSPDNPESNYHMALDTGLLSLIKQENIHRMMGEGDPQKEAERYEKLLRDILPNAAFDMVMLGIGEDGHTASLFPNTEGLKVKDRLVIANYIPQKNTWRLSLTFACLNASHDIVVYALGERKAKILKQIFDGTDHQLPIQRIGTPQHKAKIIADQAAASSIKS